jgi:hypothetical protein
MNSERLWLALLVATVFGAGMAAGTLLSFRLRPVQAGEPFQAYELRMCETFDLDEERRENLRWILSAYREKVEALKERNLAGLDAELVKIGRDHRALIRSKVVPERHLQEFDLWVGGLPVLVPSAKLH